jgi:transcriptional regulator with XRE-family HTH domain
MDDIIFVKTLKFLLEQTGTTNRKFAREIGVSERTVRRWLHGKNKPRPEHRMKIRELFKMSKEEFSALSKLKSQVEGQESKISELREEVQSVTSKIASQQTELDRMEAQRRVFSNQNQQLKTENIRLQAEKTELGGENHDLKIELRFCKTLVRTMRINYDKLKSCYDRMNNSLLSKLTTRGKVLQDGQEIEQEIADRWRKKRDVRVG